VSGVDTRFSSAERGQLVREIQTHLPAFLSPAATEQPDVVGDVSHLLNLSRSDLDRVVAVHLALTAEVRAFMDGLREGLRNPISSSIRPRTVTQAVRGSIDWGATVRYRTSVGGAATEYVVRPARRVFDTPENRALAYLLERLDVVLRRAAPAQADERAGTYNTGWFGEVVSVLRRIRSARRYHWLRDVPGERPSGRDALRLNAARSAFYKVLLRDGLTAINRYVEEPTAEAVTELLAHRYFEPQRDWQLFELVIAIRLASGFSAVASGKRRARLLVGSGRSPYARYVMPDSAEVWLWYQAWPHDAGVSDHTKARERYAIASGPSRPDFVIEHRRDGQTVDALILEVKATRAAGYLGEGLLQLLGYLKDRPSLFTHKPSGWLVAPASAAFKSASPGSLELWAVTADAVAQAAVTRFGY
jgi:hypothetical protein